MCFARTLAAVFLSLVPAIPFLIQQAATSTTQSSWQALTLLQRPLAALTGSITDVTLSGGHFHSLCTALAKTAGGGGCSSISAASTGGSRPSCTVYLNENSRILWLCRPRVSLQFL